MQYIGFTNWNKYQHYKRFDPPWIKLHRSLLDSYEFDNLSDTGRGHLLGLFMLAAKKNNRIPYDPAYIRKKISARSRINFKKFLEGENPLMELFEDSVAPVPSNKSKGTGGVKI